MDDVLALILAGGEGSRLSPLTRDRAKPAVPFGGRYRIIDFVLSNFINSRLMKIKVLTQYKSDSLNRHISRGFRMNSRFGFFVEMVPAQMRTGRDWYKGSADAVYQNLESIESEHPCHICVFGADHIYKMDVAQALRFHKKRGADCTIAAIPFPIEKASSFGVIEVDSDWRMVGFEEKPESPKPMPNDPTRALVSMGNYIFTTDALIEAVHEDARDEGSEHDFGKNIIPRMFAGKKVMVYDYAQNEIPGMDEKELGYWRDVGDIETYWETSMELVSPSPVLDLYNRRWPLLTHTAPAPPAKFVFADEKTRRIGLATDSLVSEGCIISGGHIKRTILSPYVRINSFSRVEESILFDNVEIGRHAMIRRAIIDKNSRISPYTQIGYDLEEDRRRFHVTETGIVVLPKGTVV
jgi:glucose-1-phosphate adenylyltransferase